MTDLRTMKEMEMGCYTVRYGKQETSDRYDAAVVADTRGLTSAPDGEAPIADHESKWVAIGKAIHEYNEARE